MTESDIWRETQFQCNGGGACVIVEKVAGCFVIRDSKNPTQPGLVFSKKEYADFRRRVHGDTWARTTLRFLTSLLRLAVTALRHIIA